MPGLLVAVPREGRFDDGDPPVRGLILDATWGTWRQPAGPSFALEVDASGPCLVDSTSLVCGTYLVLSDAEGAVLAEQHSGAHGLHERLAVELEACRPYVVSVTWIQGEPGPFTLSVRPGRAPSWDEDRERCRAFVEACLGESAARGETSRAYGLAQARLGVRLDKDGDLDGARRAHQRSLAIREQALDADHPELVRALMNLGDVTCRQGDLPGGRALLERALALAEARLGPESLGLCDTLSMMGRIEFDRKDTKGARAFFECALSIEEQALGPLHRSVASNLGNLGVIYERLKDLAGARALYARSIAAWKATPWPDDLQLAKRLADLAWTHDQLGDLDAARPALEGAIALREKVLGPEHALVAQTLIDLGALLRKLGDAGAERTVFERAVAIREATLKPDDPELAKAYYELGLAFAELGDLGGARRAYERALVIREAVYGPDHDLVGNNLFNLAKVLAKSGQYEAARKLLERVIPIWRKTYGPEHPRVAQALDNYGGVLEDLADYAGARENLERALAIREAARDPSLPLSLVNCGNLLHRLGDYAAARPLLERALALQESALGPGHPDVASTLNNLAFLLRDLGDAAAARPLLERALSIHEKALGPDDLRVSDDLCNLGIVLHGLGEFHKARAMFERALAIEEAVHGARHPRVANRLGSLAVACAGDGELDTARSLGERALAIEEEAYGPEHPEVATSRANLARLRLAAGDLVGARLLYERALADLEAALGSDHPEVARMLSCLVTLALDAGDPGQALTWSRRMPGSGGSVRRNLASLTEGESLVYLASVGGRREVLAAALAADDLNAAYRSVLHAKGLVARLTLQSQAQIRASLDPETLARSEALSATNARLAKLALATEVADRSDHQARLEALREERDALERALRRDTDVGEAEEIASRAVAQALPPGSALVDLLVHGSYEPGRRERDTFVQGKWTRRVSAWVLRSEEPLPRHVDLGPAEAIENAIGAHLGRIAGPGSARGLAPAPESGSSGEVGDKPTRAHADASGAALRALVWDPLRAAVGDARTVLVSPDGALGTLPFETIPDEDGRYLVEKHAFVYVSDGNALVALATADAMLGDSLLVAGGVNYERVAVPAVARAVPGGAQRAARTDDEADAEGDATADAVDDAESHTRSHLSRGKPARAFTGGWRPLPATILEAERIAALHAATRPTGSRRVLLGPDAAEEALKLEMPGSAILHLATHGFFQPEGLPSMQRQARDAAAGGRDGDAPAGNEPGARMTEAAVRLTGLHPGLLSGIVLAGASSPPSADEDRDDGYLTASEVTLLDLSGVDLVVLSACETGLGRPASGEGLLGLRRAFHMAGAGTVVSSLWSVGDQSTSELMQAFYANLLVEGLGRHEALRAAQLAMLKENRTAHGEVLPSTWGAFVLSGEWR